MLAALVKMTTTKTWTVKEEAWSRDHENFIQIGRSLVDCRVCLPYQCKMVTEMKTGDSAVFHSKWQCCRPLTCLSLINWTQSTFSHSLWIFVLVVCFFILGNWHEKWWFFVPFAHFILSSLSNHIEMKRLVMNHELFHRYFVFFCMYKKT